MFKRYILDGFNKYGDIAIAKAKEMDLDPALVCTIITIESSWEPYAETPWARGLMGVSEPAVKDVNRIFGTNYTYDDMYKPEDNIDAGTKYIRFLIDEFLEDVPVTVLFNLLGFAYNAGIGRMQQFYQEKSLAKALRKIPHQAMQYIWKITYLYPEWVKFLRERYQQ